MVKTELQRRSGLLVIVASLCFATSGPLARYAFPANPLVIAAGRTFVAFFLLFLFDWKEIFSSVRALRAGPLLRVVGAGGLLAAHFACFLLGLTKTSLPAAVSLVSLEPVAVVLVALALFGMRPTRMEGVGVFVATGGAVFIAQGAGQGEHTLSGDLLVLLAVALYGFYLAAARASASLMPARAYSACVFLFASAFLLIACLLFGAEPPRSMHSWVAILLLGIVPTVFGHTLVQWSSRFLRPATVALVSPGETIGSLLISALLLKSMPSPAEGLGALLVLSGVILTLMSQAAPRDESQSPMAASGE